MSTQVVLKKCKNYEPQELRKALRSALQELGGIRNFIKSGQRVLLKPNFILAKPVSSAATTHPEFIIAAAEMVYAAGGRPVVGDSPAFGSAVRVAHKLGLTEPLKKLGVPVIDLRQPGELLKVGHHIKVKLARQLNEFDAIINLPKVKSHSQLRCTLATKNLFGLVPARRKAFQHFRLGDQQNWFAEMVVAVARKVNPVLTLVDGIISMEGDGPARGDPRETGFLAAGTDLSAIDRVVLELLQIPPAEVPIMVAARDAGFGTTDLEQITLLGESIEELQVENFKPADPTPIQFSPTRIIQGLYKHLKAKYRHP